ncbi:MAG: beta-lactamase family protein [bacterium]|nr:beta-lactamase family protein [bacterium]
MNATLSRISKRRPTFSRDLIGTVAVSLLLYAGGCVLPQQKVGPGGFSAKRLEAVTTALQDAVDRGEVGGIVTLLFRRGEVAQVNAVGWQDKAATIPMARDSIFRIASMSKPITAVATLILLDEGKFALDDPVDRWLPELADPEVLRDPTEALDSGYPSPHPIRVIDLLTHRSGIVTPRADPGPLLDALTEADANNSVGYDQWLAWIGALPLAHEPGTTFDYGNSYDVLGIFVERVSGKKFPDFVRERIFEPLGMDDTAFWVPPDKRSHMARLQSLGRVPASWIPTHTEVPAYPSAAGGLHSTVDDYLRFARMLLGRGELGGERILLPSTVDAMTTNYLTPEQRKGLPFGGPQGYWEGQGFGLGVAVKQSPTVVSSELGIASVGSFGWPGVFGTWWEADPQQDMIQIFMVPGGDAKPARWAFQAAAYQAIGN